MKILVVTLTNLGDTLLSYPALTALWYAYPQDEFHVLCSPRNKELFIVNPRVKRVWVWDKQAGLWKGILMTIDLVLEGFGLVVDFRNTMIPLLMPWAKRTPVFSRPKPGDRHRLDTHLELVTRLGVRPYEAKIRLPFDSREERKVEQWLESGRQLVVMVPGARSHLKRWGAEKFAEVADRLIEQNNAQVMLAGEEAERPIAAQVSAAMRHKPTDMVGKTTVRQLADLISHAKLVITNDNACLHMATMAGSPTVAIFGPTDERKYGPRAPGSVVVRRNMICAPCELALCPYTHGCMRWIEADEVYAAAAKILETSVRAELVEARIGKS